MVDAERLDRQSCAFKLLLEGRQVADQGAHDDELLAPVAGHHIGITFEVMREHSGYGLQRVIAAHMPIEIVVSLEGVNIDEGETQGRMKPLVDGPEACKLFFQKPAVVETCQRVLDGELFEMEDPVLVLADGLLSIHQRRDVAQRQKQMGSPSRRVPNRHSPRLAPERPSPLTVGQPDGLLRFYGAQDPLCGKVCFIRAGQAIRQLAGCPAMSFR